MTPHWKFGSFAPGDRARLRRLSDEFEGALPWHASDTSGRLIGLEHEYGVSINAQAQDFRTLVHSLALGQSHLDPADPNAYRLPSGAAITADEGEAEIALPPLSCERGFATRLAGAAQAERLALAARLPAGAQLIGYSTHLSVSVPPESADALARLYASTFAASLMLLLDKPTSPGLLIRPRPYRLELGGDFIDGEQLTVVALFVVGTVRACLRVMRGEIGDLLPPSLSPLLASDDRRYGLYISRRAFGPDLYSRGRRCTLTMADGRTISAQSHLEKSWRAARATIGGDATEKELNAGSALVLSSVALPTPRHDTDKRQANTGCVPLTSSWGTAVRPSRRDVFEMAPVMLTWHVVVFLVLARSRHRHGFVCIPGPCLGSFLRELDRGDFDPLISGYLAVPPSGRLLATMDQALTGGLFDYLGSRADLLPTERDATQARSLLTDPSDATGRWPPLLRSLRVGAESPPRPSISALADRSHQGPSGWVSLVGPGLQSVLPQTLMQAAVARRRCSMRIELRGGLASMDWPPRKD